jgi:LCP family protein required for cell wall assembly
VAAFLSFLLPGLGQAASGKPRRGAIIAIPAVVLTAVFILMLVFARHALMDGLVTSTWLVSLLLLDVVAAFYHVWAVVDAYLSVEKPFDGRPVRGMPKRRPLLRGAGVPILMAVLVATLGIHLFFGVTDVTAQNAISCVFRPGAPCGIANGGNFGPGTSVADQTLDPADFGTVAPSGSAAPAGTAVPGWVSTTDGVKVRSGAGTTFTVIAQLAVGTTITGQVVTGASYISSAGTSTDWIKIDDGQALAGGYVAKAYFDTTMVTPATIAPSSTLPPIVYPTSTLPPAGNVATNWDADGYLNVLLVGADSGAGRADMRTDTMMLMQVKIATGQAALYGIPRNLYNVPLPPQWQGAWACHCFYGYQGSPAGGGNYMLNALWQWGAWRAPDKFPNTGATTDFERGFKVLEATVGQMTGVHVDGVVYINLLGFVKIIDDLGGLDMYVPKSIHDATMPYPDRGGTYVLDIPAGQHHFSGVEALAYARTRHQDDDFGRMARQQDVIKAIRSNFKPCSLLPKVNGLLADLGGMLWTDLPQDDAARLAGLAQAIGGNNVQSYAFSPANGYNEYVTPAEVTKMQNAVAHGLDNAPKSTGTGGSGGGGFSC